MSEARVASLSSVFQDAFVVTLRVRSRVQQVADAGEFRKEIRGILRRATEAARMLGYRSESVQMAVFATVAFLDESVLNLGDAVFADWSRRPLQEELFGGHLAGETFYRNMQTYLHQHDSAEVADVLEVHCLCLLLGYRGRYAFGEAGDVRVAVRQAKTMIDRIRGEAELARRTPPPALPPQPVDHWGRRLLRGAGALLLLVVVLYAIYAVLLSIGVGSVRAQGAACAISGVL